MVGTTKSPGALLLGTMLAEPADEAVGAAVGAADGTAAGRVARGTTLLRGCDGADAVGATVATGAAVIVGAALGVLLGDGAVRTIGASGSTGPCARGLGVEVAPGSRYSLTDCAVSGCAPSPRASATALPAPAILAHERIIDLHFPIIGRAR